MSKTVKVGLIGAGFVSDLHAHSFKHSVKMPKSWQSLHLITPRNLPRNAGSPMPLKITARC